MNSQPRNNPSTLRSQIVHCFKMASTNGSISPLALCWQPYNWGIGPTCALWALHESFGNYPCFLPFRLLLVCYCRPASIKLPPYTGAVHHDSFPQRNHPWLVYITIWLHVGPQNLNSYSSAVLRLGVGPIGWFCSLTCPPKKNHHQPY